jgi:hypothetical protein
MDNESIGPVSIEFVINNPELLADAQKAQETLTNASNEVNKQAQAAAEAINNQLKTETTALNNTMTQNIERLKINLAQYQQIAALTLDPQKLAQYNQMIEQTAAEITRLGNVGRTGFDELGNALPVEQTSKFGAAISRVTDLGNIGSRMVTNFSRQLIQLGTGFLSGIIGAKAIEMLITYISNLDIFTGRLDVAKQTMSSWSDVLKQSADNAAKGITEFQLYVDVLKDSNSSLQDRINAGEKIKELLPNETANVSALAIANGALKDSYDKLTASILKQATAQAAISKIQELEKQKLELQSKQQDIQVKADEDKSAATGYAASTSYSMPGSGSYTPAISKQQNQQGIQEMADYQKQKIQPQIDVIDQTIKNIVKLGGGASALADQLNGIGSKLQVTLQNFSSVLANSTTKQDFERMQKSLQQTVDNPVGLSTAQLDQYKKDLQQVEDIINQRFSVKPSGTGAENRGQALLAQQTSLLQNIDALKKEYAAKDETRDDQAVEQLKARFQKEYDAIVAYNQKRQNFIDGYNKTHKAGGGEAYANSIGLTYQDPNQLQATEDNAVAALRAQQSVDVLKNQIDQQKAIFQEYEQFKLKAGTQAADELYAYQLKGYKSYLDYLKSLEPTEAQLTSSDPATKAHATATSDLLNKTLIPQAKKDEQVQALKDLQQYITATQSFEDQRKAIISKTNDEVASLTQASNDEQADAIKRGDLVMTGVIADDYANRIKMAKDQGAAQLDLLNVQQAQQLQSYEGLAASVQSLSTQQALLRIEQAKDQLVMNQSKMSADDYAQALKYIKQAEDALLLDGIAQGLGELGQLFETLSASVSGFDKSLSNTFRDMATFFKEAQQISTGIGNISDAVKNYQQNAANAGGGFTGSLSATLQVASAAIPVVGAVISMVGSVINFFKAAKQSAIEAQKQMQAYQQSLIDNQYVYNEAQRDQIRNQQDINTLTGIELQQRQQMLQIQLQQAEAEYNNLLAQGEATGKQITGEHTEKYGGFLGIAKKTKVVQDTAGIEGLTYDQLAQLDAEGKLDDATKQWFESLKNAKDEIDQINQATADTAAAMQKLYTGTTANDIASGIIQGFEQGKRSAADFASDFGTLMNNALVSVFESNVLDDELKQFYQDFANDSENGGLTADKIAQLRDEYNKIVSNSVDQLNQIQQITGTQLGNGSSSGSSTTLAGQIQGITADQANLLEGALNGMHLAVVETNDLITGISGTMAASLSELKSQTLLQMQIVANTKRVADNSDVMVDKLKDIDSNTSSTNLIYALRAAGH